MKKLVLFITSIITVVILTACSSNSMKNKLQEVKEKNKIVLGVSPDYPPYEFLTTENGNKKVVGADIYLAEQVAKKLGVQVEIQQMAFDSLIAALNANKVDMVISGVNPTEERKKAVDFLSDYHFDLCFVGTNGIHPTVGYTTSNEYEASTKRYAITHSDKAFILADSSKINKLNTYEFAKLHEATLICDSIKDFPADKLKYKLVM